MPNEDGSYSKDEFESAMATANAATAAAKAQSELLQSQADSQADANEAKQRESANAAPASPRNFTREQLSAAVEAGDLTQESMDAQLDLQARRQFKAEISTELRQEFEETRKSDKLGQAIDTYKEAFPDLTDRSSALRGRLRKEMDRLVSTHGMDEAARTTELLAMERVCGDPNIQTVERTNQAHQHEQGVGGTAGSDAGGEADGAVVGMSADQRAFYENGIREGLYKSMDDPDIAAEMKIFNARRQAAA